jgi:hypothetical protein
MFYVCMLLQILNLLFVSLDVYCIYKDIAHTDNQ